MPPGDGLQTVESGPASREAVEAQAPRMRTANPNWQKLMPKKASDYKMRAGNNWENLTDSDENPDEYHIDRDSFPEGMDLQWWTREVYGQVLKERMATAFRGGWTPVHDEDFDGWHKRVIGGRYALDESGYIIHKGQVLCARPMEISAKAKKRDAARAQEQISQKAEAFKSGDMNVSDPRDPSATAFNRSHGIRKSWERIEVPKD